MPIMLKRQSTIADLFNHRDMLSGETWDSFTTRRNFHPVDRFSVLTWQKYVDAHEETLANRRKPKPNDELALGTGMPHSPAAPSV